jgi:hypothetical protein
MDYSWVVPNLSVGSVILYIFTVWPVVYFVFIRVILAPSKQFLEGLVTIFDNIASEWIKAGVTPQGLPGLFDPNGVFVTYITEKITSIITFLKGVAAPEVLN